MQMKVLSVFTILVSSSVSITTFAAEVRCLDEGYLESRTAAMRARRMVVMTLEAAEELPVVKEKNANGVSPKAVAKWKDHLQKIASDLKKTKFDLASLKPSDSVVESVLKSMGRSGKATQQEVADVKAGMLKKFYGSGSAAAFGYVYDRVESGTIFSEAGLDPELLAHKDAAYFALSALVTPIKEKYQQDMSEADKDFRRACQVASKDSPIPTPKENAARKEKYKNPELAIKAIKEAHQADENDALEVQVGAGL